MQWQREVHEENTSQVIQGTWSLPSPSDEYMNKEIQILRSWQKSQRKMSKVNN